MNHAVFFERDGILNLPAVESRLSVAAQSLECFRINEQAAPLLGRLKEAGFILIATTNQPGLSDGSLSRHELDRMHGQLRRSLPHLDDVLVCPHSGADECPCRKPRPGLLTEAAFKWQLDLERSFIISDKWQDAAAGRMVGASAFLLQSPWLGFGRRDFVLPSLEAIGDRILKTSLPPGTYWQPCVPVPVEAGLPMAI